MTMTRVQAKNLARDLRGGGKTYDDIAAILTEKGYVNARSKAPITVGGVQSLLFPQRTRRSKATKAKPVQSSMDVAGNLLNMIRTILGTESFTDAQRMELIRTVLK